MKNNAKNYKLIFYKIKMIMNLINKIFYKKAF